MDGTGKPGQSCRAVRGEWTHLMRWRPSGLTSAAQTRSTRPALFPARPSGASSCSLTMQARHPLTMLLLFVQRFHGSSHYHLPGASHCNVCVSMHHQGSRRVYLCAKGSHCLLCNAVKSTLSLLWSEMASWSYILEGVLEEGTLDLTLQSPA